MTERDSEKTSHKTVRVKSLHPNSLWSASTHCGSIFYRFSRVEKKGSFPFLLFKNSHATAKAALSKVFGDFSFFLLSFFCLNFLDVNKSRVGLGPRRPLRETETN